MKRVLFICKFNQTRSQMARAIFNRLNKNKEIIADSMGVINANQSKELDSCLTSIFRKHNLKRTKRKFLDKEILNKQSLIVIVADDVPISLFDSQKRAGIKVIKLKIKDGWKYKEKTRAKRLERVYSDIEKKLDKLISINEVSGK